MASLEELKARIERLEKKVFPEAPTPEKPPAPEGLVGIAYQKSRKIDLAWNPIPGATYRIYEAATPKGLETVTTNQSSRGPLAHGSYRYWVTAIVNGVESDPSEVVALSLADQDVPTAPPDTADKPVTTGGRIVFLGDFRTGDFRQWSTVQKKGYNGGPSSFRQDSGLKLLTPATGGHSEHPFSARFQVGPGDVPPFGGGERCELAQHDAALVHEGDERWYEFSLKFDEGFKNSSDWFIVMQWHAGNGSPPLALQVEDDTLVLDNNRDRSAGQKVGPIVKGKWVDYVLHTKFSSKNGWAEMWQDGKYVLPRHNRVNMAGSENYFKMGIYRDRDNSTAVVYHAGLRITAP